MFARADANRGNLQRARDLTGCFRTHDFEHDCECARLLHDQAIAHERLSFGLRAAFDFVAAFFAHTLRQHSDVAYEGNPFRYDRLDLWDVTDAALELDGLRARFDQRARRGNGLRGRFVGVNGEIADQQGTLHTA